MVTIAIQKLTPKLLLLATQWGRGIISDTSKALGRTGVDSSALHFYFVPLTDTFLSHDVYHSSSVAGNLTAPVSLDSY